MLFEYVGASEFPSPLHTHGGTMSPCAMCDCGNWLSDETARDINRMSSSFESFYGNRDRTTSSLAATSCDTTVVTSHVSGTERRDRVPARAVVTKLLSLVSVVWVMVPLRVVRVVRVDALSSMRIAGVLRDGWSLEARKRSGRCGEKLLYVSATPFCLPFHLLLRSLRLRRSDRSSGGPRRRTWIAK